jgi:hypothetical protein
MLSCIGGFICGEHWKVVFSMEFGSAARAAIVICGGGRGNGAVVIIGSCASITTLDSMLIGLLLLPWGDEFWKD